MIAGCWWRAGVEEDEEWSYIFLIADEQTEMPVEVTATSLLST